MASMSKSMLNQVNTRVELPAYSFMPAIADTAPGTKDNGFSTEENVMPAISVIVYADGEQKGVWSVTEFRDRVSNLQEIIDSNQAITGKEYDPFAIMGDNEENEADEGNRNQQSAGFFFDNTIDL